MPKRNLHSKPFDDATNDKLELFRKYLRGWLPVFLNSPHIETLQVFDFFAGPGSDVGGSPGSPVIICEEVQAALRAATRSDVKIKIFLNELSPTKCKQLSALIKERQAVLREADFTVSNGEFHATFSAWEPLMKGKTANLLSLDQNGVQQITFPIFDKTVRTPHTDFLFFISSAMVNRFKNMPEIRNCVPVTDDDLSLMDGTNVHRILTNAHNRWIPEGLEFYLGPFSIKKGSNVYGLVFGSRHPLGIDKFLHVAWQLGGEANFDIDGDGINPEMPSLFAEYNKPTKLTRFEKDLETAILEGRVTTNKDVYIFSLRNGVLPKHARDALKEMMKKNAIQEQHLHVTYNAWENVGCEDIII